MRTVFLAGLLVVLLTGSVYAMSGAQGCGSQECASCHSLTTTEASKLLGFAGFTVKSVKPAPARGLFEVLVERGGNLGIVFIDYAKKHLVQGPIIDLKTRQPVFAHANELPKPKQFTGVDPRLIPTRYALTMGNPKGSKRLYVFTDPDCPFCRQLHPLLLQLVKQMPDLAIEFMLYPLRQLHPQSYDKARVIYASHSILLLNEAFAGQALPAPNGDEGAAAINAIIAFAQKEGISATPTILLANGKPYTGPRDVASLRQAVEAK